MLTVNRLREFLIEVKQKIAEIKYTQIVIDDSEFSKFLEERKVSDNTLLFCVLPDHSVDGNENSTQFANYLQFFILDKAANKNLKHDEKLDMYNKIQAIVKKFVQMIILEKSGEEGDFCGLMTDFVESSLKISLVWDKQQCWGYEIIFELMTPLD